MVDSMRYISTRDESRTEIPFSDILLGGLAPDGGLYLPAEYPQVTGDMLDRWRKLLNTQGYPALAAEVLQLFIDDIPADDLTDIAYRAYTFPKFAHAEIVPVTKLEDGMYIGHLSEGPTAALKTSPCNCSGNSSNTSCADGAKPSPLLGQLRVTPGPPPNTP